MMNEDQDDFYLSDHLIENVSYNVTDKHNIFRARIELAFPACVEKKNLFPKEEKQENEQSVSNIDIDGDLVLKRKQDLKKFLIHVEHHRQTKLKDVGKQLWRASFYLSDYLIYLQGQNDNDLHLLKDKIVIDLGSGLGISSFISSLFAKSIYCTDLKQIVELAEINWNINKKTFEEISNRNITDIFFKEINWFNYKNFLNEKNSNCDSLQLNKEDLARIKEARVYIAADVVYDNNITHAFMNTLYKLMTYGRKESKVCFIANEQRINFNTEDFKITRTAYDFFKKCLDDLNDYVDEISGYRFETQCVKDLKIPKYFINYNRNDYLYIWMIKCFPI
jgi:predicted nicotinamide N-methyase